MLIGNSKHPRRNNILTTDLADQVTYHHQWCCSLLQILASQPLTVLVGNWMEAKPGPRSSLVSSDPAALLHNLHGSQGSSSLNSPS